MQKGRRTEGQTNGHDEANHRAIWQKRIRIALILRVLLVERTLDSGLQRESGINGTPLAVHKSWPRSCFRMCKN